jgi:hypothetical protein
MDPAIPTIVSVIVTGVVAIVSVLVPFIIEWRKSKQEKIAAEMERIDKSMLELLGELSNFRHWVMDDIEMSARRPIQQVFTDLQVKHYAWERAVWSRLNADDRGRVIELRQRFEKVHVPDELAKDVANLANEILSLTYSATRRI